MTTRTKVVIVTLLVGFAAFLTEPHGPLGGFWPPAADVPVAVGLQIPLFMVLGIAEALVCGLGVAFLFWGFPMMKGVGAASPALTRGAHLSIVWILVNWWAHDSLHLHNGMDLNGLLGIEYGFHLPLMAAGATLALFFLAACRGEAPRAAGA